MLPCAIPSPNGLIEGRPIMNSMSYTCLATGLGLMLTAGLTQTASAQSTKDDMVRAVLLGQQEFVETMADVTPELLRLQEELVKTLRAGFESAQDQFRQGTEMDFTDIAQTYYKELEAL